MEIKNFGQLLQHLATKAGIDPKDQNLINLLSNAELTKVTVHSDVVKALDENLVPMSAAEDVFGPKFKAQALNAFDKKMESILEELGLDDSSKAEIKGIRSSYDRFEKLTGKLKELAEKKDNAGGKGEKDALQKQIDELLGKLQTEKKTYDEALAKVQNERLQDKIGFELRGIFGGVKTIYDQLDPSIRTTSIEAIMNKALQDKDAEFAYDDKGSFSIRKKDGTALLGAGHTKYTPQTFIDEILAQNKILAVSNGTNQNNNAGGGTKNTTSVSTDGQPVNGTNQSVANINLEMMRTFQAEQ